MKTITGRLFINALVALAMGAALLQINPVAAADEEPGKDDPRIRLLTAILTDDAPQVQMLLKEGVDPNIREVDRGPALVMAVQEESVKSVRELLASPKLEVDAVNKRGETALMMAALIGQTETVGMLIEKGATLDPDGWTPLHYAASSGKVGVIEKLIEAGADKNARSPNGTTPMMMAVRRGNLTAYQKLLIAGADPTIKNDRGLTTVDYLERQGETERAELLRTYVKQFAVKADK